MVSEQGIIEANRKMVLIWGRSAAAQSSSVGRVRRIRGRREIRDRRRVHQGLAL